VERGAPVFLDTTVELIRAANAVLVVLTDHHSPNTLVETGLAMGLGRPVLLIAEDSAISDGLVPDPLLSRLPRVRAKLGDRDALRFHVGAFLDGVEQRPPADRSPQRPRQPSVQLTRKRTTRPSHPESELERRLLSSFEDAQEVEAVLLEPQLDGSRRFRPDFALWLRDPRQVIPNPLIIELVGGEAVRRGSGERRLVQLQKYASHTGVGAVMLVEDAEGRSLSLLNLSPLIFRIGLSELEGLLLAEQLVPEMMRARNSLAHSVG
jgi:hypothetical protein